MIIHYLSESGNGCAATNANRLFKSIFLSLSLYFKLFFNLFETRNKSDFEIGLLERVFLKCPWKLKNMGLVKGLKCFQAKWAKSSSNEVTALTHCIGT